jgi:hypothetical protein
MTPCSCLLIRRQTINHKRWMTTTPCFLLIQQQTINNTGLYNDHLLTFWPLQRPFTYFLSKKKCPRGNLNPRSKRVNPTFRDFPLKNDYSLVEKSYVLREFFELYSLLLTTSSIVALTLRPPSQDLKM